MTIQLPSSGSTCLSAKQQPLSAGPSHNHTSTMSLINVPSCLAAWILDGLFNVQLGDAMLEPEFSLVVGLTMICRISICTTKCIQLTGLGCQVAVAFHI